MSTVGYRAPPRLIKQTGFAPSAFFRGQKRNKEKISPRLGRSLRMVLPGMRLRRGSLRFPGAVRLAARAAVAAAGGAGRAAGGAAAAVRGAGAAGRRAGRVRRRRARLLGHLHALVCHTHVCKCRSIMTIYYYYTKRSDLLFNIYQR